MDNAHTSFPDRRVLITQNMLVMWCSIILNNLFIAINFPVKYQ